MKAHSLMCKLYPSGSACHCQQPGGVQGSMRQPAETLDSFSMFQTGLCAASMTVRLRDRCMMGSGILLRYEPAADTMHTQAART